MLPNDSAHYVCSPWQVALVTPFTCTNLRRVLRPCLSKLAYMSHVVWVCEQVRDGCRCSHRRRDRIGINIWRLPQYVAGAGPRDARQHR